MRHDHDGAARHRCDAQTHGAEDTAVDEPRLAGADHQGVIILEEAGELLRHGPPREYDVRRPVRFGVREIRIVSGRHMHADDRDAGRGSMRLGPRMRRFLATASLERQDISCRHSRASSLGGMPSSDEGGRV